jgi:hypothetical protein
LITVIERIIILKPARKESQGLLPNSGLGLTSKVYQWFGIIWLILELFVNPRRSREGKGPGCLP